MTGGILGPRELNRATLARQMLLEREGLPASGATARLVGLQAQIPNPPYVGLWTRLRGFRQEDLSRLVEERRVVRAPLMRSTLHLMTAGDYLALWPVLQPALLRALNAFFGKRARGVDVEGLVAAAREALEEAPRTMGELKAVLAEVEPGRDGDALNYVVRAHLPILQVPPAGTWGSGAAAAYATAESWLGRPPSGPESPLRDLLFRYLRAFGPASVMDFQAWSGLVRLKGPVEELKGELRSFRDGRGAELLDLPNAPLPPADAPAPPRFVPEYDNLVLSHADRARVIAEEHRGKVFLSAGRVRATFLVDGFVAGTWKVEKAKEATTLVVEPFRPLPGRVRDALAEEGEGLLRFVAETDGAGAREVRFSEAP